MHFAHAAYKEPLAKKIKKTNFSEEKQRCWQTKQGL
jgi:hypothetical protein